MRTIQGITVLIVDVSGSKNLDEELKANLDIFFLQLRAQYFSMLLWHEFKLKWNCCLFLGKNIGLAVFVFESLHFPMDIVTKENDHLFLVTIHFLPVTRS